MNFLTLEKYMPRLYRSGTSTTLVSSPGRGKSTFIRNMPDVMRNLTGEEWGYASFTAATASQLDLAGFTVPVKDDEGNLISQSTMPMWYQCRDPKTERMTGKYAHHYKYGILNIEEWGQGDIEIKRIGAELLLNKRVGSYQLPEGWVVNASTNYSTDRSGVTKEIDLVINRRKEIHITDDLVSWEHWAMRNNVNPVLIHFTNKHPDIVFSKGVPDKQGPWCTPRSLVLLGKDLDQLLDENGNIPFNDDIQEICRGWISTADTAALTVWLRMGMELPSLSDIVARPNETVVPTPPDVQMMLCYRLGAVVTETNVEPIIEYLNRLPKEFGYIFNKSALARLPKLVNTAAMSKWMMANQSLISAMR